MIAKTAVTRPTTFFIIFVLLVSFGLYTITDLAIDLYPEVTPPVLLVFTNYSGAGPEEIEKLITRPLEGALSNVANIDKIISTSSEGSSQITIRFTYGTNMDEASNDVRDKIEMVKSSLPETATTPQIFKFDPAMIPILFLIVKGNRSPEELKQIAEKYIEPRLEQIEGVAFAGVSGGRDRAVMVEIPLNRLEAYNLTLTQVSSMLKGQNVQISAGSIDEGSKSYLIRTSGEYRSIEEIQNTVIAYKPATNPRADGGSSNLRAIRLRDIANVYDGYKKETSTVLINGKPGVYIIVQKQSGTNSVRTADNVLKRIPRINQSLPSGVSVEVLRDTTVIIRDSLAQVSESAVSGGILAVVILFVFLRSLRTTFIIGLTIPVSIIITLTLMYFAGLTLNLMTLTGLALGIGMLVDNSIVILENIYRYREKGAKLKPAAILGTSEMLTAITASTLTTIVVFAPVALFKNQLGMIGEMLASLSFTIVISLTASLFVAIFLVPVLASHYLPISSRKEQPLRGIRKWIDDRMARFFDGLDNAYRSSLRFVLGHRKLTIGVILVLFLGSLTLIRLTGFEFIPTMKQDFVLLNVELPIGTRHEVTRTVLQQLEEIVKQEVKGYKDIVISAGQRSFFGFLGGIQGYRGTLQVTLPAYKERIDDSETIKMKLRKHFNDFPGAVFSFQEGQGGPTRNPVDILVKSNDLRQAKDTADRIRDLLKKEVPEATEPTVDLNDGLPQVEIFINRDRAYNLGLNIATIGAEIRASIDGIVSSKYRIEGDEYDIVVILDPQDRDTVPDLNRIFVLNAQGKRIPLSSFASLERTVGPVSIKRENQGRVVHVTAGSVPGTDLNKLEAKIRTLITERVPTPEGMIIEFSGDYADLLKYGNRLIIILIISVGLVFGVMASQFESFLDPFIILFTIPLTLIGVILIHVATHTNFSTFTAVGLVTLAGVVVNNGIVLVDYTNLLRKRGLPIKEACVEAGGNRLRPILMTTLTTVLALLPVAFRPSEGADLIQPISKTIFGGLTVSTLFTLFLIPVIYSIFNEISEKRAKKRAEKRQRIRETRKLTMATPGSEST
ncbi:MAG: efflux RND transporter permease subunit [Spirochaetes bacterium]|nr:efflux RND transporter permease subunit [Spirochaetota bacterium]